MTRHYFCLVACFWLSLSLLLGVSHARGQPFELEGRVVLNEIDSETPYLLSTVRVSMDGGLRVGIPNDKGKFWLKQLSPGKHNLEIESPAHVFDPFVVSVDSSGKVRVLNLRTKERFASPTTFASLGKNQFVKPKSGYNFMNLLKSPMGMMIGMMAFMSLVMPKMMDAVKEQQAELRTEEAKAAAAAAVAPAQGTDASHRKGVAQGGARKRKRG